MKKIVHRTMVGSKVGLAVVTLNEGNRLENESDQEFLERYARKMVPKDMPHCFMDDPSKILDRQFRECWVWRGDKDPKLTIDLSCAKEVWINKWRKAREAKFKVLDILFLKAVESGDKEQQEEIAQKKQALRDVTKHDLSSVNDVAELKKVWPSTLVD